jgi:hypothetical protein
MKKRYFFLIWAAVLTLGFLYAHSLKEGKINIDYSNVENAEMLYMDWTENPATPWRYDRDISDAELEALSDMVTQATVISSAGKNNCTLTAVEADGKTYEIYEYGELINNSVYASRNGYAPMLPNRKYLLYLQTFDNPYTGERAYLLTNIYRGKTLCL